MATNGKGVAIVTGAAQGIGRGIAYRLASDGFAVVLSDVEKQKGLLDTSVEEIKAKGGKAIAIVTDVRSEDEVKQLVAQTVQQLGGLDVMVANAGIIRLSKFVDLAAETLSDIFAVNVHGVFHCYKHAAIHMIKQGRGGRIIGASSNSGKAGLKLLGGYSASKFAVRGLTQSAALELGKHAITVNAYAPGGIDTPLSRGFVDLLKEANLDMSDFSYATPAVAQLGQPEDIAALVSYLASKEAHFITGQTVTVDGGVVLD